MANKSDQVHGIPAQLQGIMKNIRENEDITEEDIEMLEKMGRWIDQHSRINSLTKKRDYLQKTKQIAEGEDFTLHDLLPEPDGRVSSIIESIQTSAYATRTDEYAPDTKKMFKQALKRLIEYQSTQTSEYSNPKEAKDAVLPYDFRVYVPEEEKNRTEPEDLPRPSDVKELAQKIEAVCRPRTGTRNVALLMLLWDAGCRIGEALSLDCRHVKKITDKYVEVKIQGNKKSPDRNVKLVIAAPMLKHYVNNVHPSFEDPDSPLFPVLGDQATQGKRLSANSYTNIVQRALKQSNINKNWENEKNHIFRKGRITYLKKAEIMGESTIDNRVGHVPGSDVTRAYTRIGDNDANESYMEGYGIETEEENTLEEDLKPLKCSKCSELNSGHRDICRSCTNKLTEEAYPENIIEKEENKQKLEVGSEIKAIAKVLGVDVEQIKEEMGKN